MNEEEELSSSENIWSKSYWELPETAGALSGVPLPLALPVEAAVLPAGRDSLGAAGPRTPTCAEPEASLTQRRLSPGVAAPVAVVGPDVLCFANDVVVAVEDEYEEGGGC